MSQSFIDALMHFFSLLFLPLPGKRPRNIRESLEEYFEKAAIAYPVDECLKIFNSYTTRYYFELTSQAYKPVTDAGGIRKELLHEAGNKAQNNLYLQERLLVILALLEFNRIHAGDDEENAENIGELAASLNLSREEFADAFDFIRDDPEKRSANDLIITEEEDRTDELEGVWIEEHKPEQVLSPDNGLIERVRGEFHFRYFSHFNYMIFRYTGDDEVFLNGKRVWERYFYSFRKKDRIRIGELDPFYYDEIEDLFISLDRPPKIRLEGKNIFYRYSSTHYSIKPFTFGEDSGQLIGILGNNGSGKTTILKLIGNQLEPTQGHIFINGADLLENRFKLKSVIAYISAEDLLFPELSVYENLYFHAQLTLGSLSDREIRKKIGEILERFGLAGIQHVRAGMESDHRITNFQRVCLRIAMEMIRNPYILCLDEPLSGLSYADSRRLLSILKEEAYKGKLIFITSPLPSTELFNLFDGVWLIDQDGYMIYTGEPAGSLSHFRNAGLLPYYYILTGTREVNPEDVIKIVETKKIHSDGTISDERLVSPGAWYDAWRANDNKMRTRDTQTKKPVPINPSRLPGIEKQFLIYLVRNFRVRLSNMKYLFLTLAGIPAAGALAALTIRMVYGTAYNLGGNEYLPLYIFLSVNYMLFSGLLTGAGEMIHDRDRIRRDLSVNLSFFSFRNSKVAYLLSVSAIQSFLFAICGNIILGIRGILLSYWIVYFALAAFGNLTSLALSAAFRRTDSLYIFLLFFLFPNLLFSGYMIRFNHDSPDRKEESTLPVFAELIPGRWGYEGLMVEQYAANPYNRYFFNDEKKIYQSRFLLRYTLPALEKRLDHCDYLYHHVQEPQDSMRDCLHLISRELKEIGDRDEIAPFERQALLQKAFYDSSMHQAIYGYLTYLRFLMENNINETTERIKITRQHLADSLAGRSLEAFRKANQNVAVQQLVTQPGETPGVILTGNRMIKTGSPVFLPSEPGFGNERFFSSFHKFNGQRIPALRFNISMIWVLNLLVYILFLTDALKYLKMLLNNR